MTCRRCPSLTPITVEQAGVELCRVCAQLPRETQPTDQSPARPARSKR
jgi:ribosome-binding protein aMBF1 (putative translation factor)